MIEREQYLKTLRLFKNKSLIKVITGIRRSGKSTLMEQFIEELKSEGIKQNQIIHINFEDIQFEHLLNYKAMYNYILERLNENSFNYIFLDEVQKVKDFQKAVDSLYIKKNVDVYVTGSNSDLLSSELSSLLTGRYIEIKMLPLSFKEFCLGANEKEDKKALFNDYLKYGAFPYVMELPTNDAKDIYLEGLYNTILNVDIARRYNNVDIGVMESILKFLYHNVGSLVSSTNIANTLSTNGRKTSYNTVEKYIEYLKQSFLIYEANRYDVKGKQHLKSLSKYYAVDLGLRNLLLANNSYNIGHVLENIIYFELLRRGYKVHVGKLENKEVDFVAIKGDEIEYFQVSASVLNEETFNREISSLNAIKDSYPKTLITLDDYYLGNANGIKIKNAIDFLLN